MSVVRILVRFLLDSEVVEQISTPILASMWACTRPSACIASLRTVSDVVRSTALVVG
jgi:hypothetical protein